MKQQKNNEAFEPLLQNEKDTKIIDYKTITDNKSMGGTKWHKMLRQIGPNLVGIQGFLNERESVLIKTLTKETLGEINLKTWRGLHPKSKQHCYTQTYLFIPWDLTCDPCNMMDVYNGEGAWVCCWLPCCIAICPLTFTASFLGGLVGASRDCYNFSKKGIVHPIDDSTGIKLGLFVKSPVYPAPRRQMMEDNPLHSLNA